VASGCRSFAGITPLIGRTTSGKVQMILYQALKVVLKTAGGISQSTATILPQIGCAVNFDFQFRFFLERISLLALITFPDGKFQKTNSELNLPEAWVQPV
jgi:hypothetical protein